MWKHLDSDLAVKKKLVHQVQNWAQGWNVQALQAIQCFCTKLSTKNTFRKSNSKFICMDCLVLHCEKVSISLKYNFCWQLSMAPPAAKIGRKKSMLNKKYHILDNTIMCPVHFSYRDGRHGGGHKAVWGGTFDWWWYPLLSRVMQITQVFGGEIIKFALWIILGLED